MLLLQHFKELTIRPKNAQELKGLILQLAIQGKLTANWREKNPAIEPASVLLNRITKEKAELIKNKTIKKSKVIPEIPDQEIPYQLPSSWSWSRLGNITKQITDGTHHTPKYIDSGVKFVSIRDISSGKLDFSKTRFISEEEHKSLIERCNPERNDILFCRIGTLGVPVIIDTDEPFSIFVSVGLLKFFIEDIIPEFLQKTLDSPFLWSQYMEVKAGGSHTNKLNLRDMPYLKIPLPPLEEQKEIVKVVETLFKEVEQLEQLTVKRIGLKEDFVTSALHQFTTNNANQEWTFLQDHFKSFFNETTNIKKLRETVLQLAVQGKLTADWRANNPNTEDASQLLKRIQEEKAQLIAAKKIKKEKALPPITDDEIPYELPEGWVWCRLQDLVNVGTGSTPAKSNSSYYNGTIPWYTSSATNDLYAKESEKLITEKALQETNCKVFPKGTLIIAMYGQGKTRGQISELVIPGATNQAVAAMVFYKTSKDFKEYIKYFFRKIYDEIRLLAEGGAQPNLNVGKIKNTILPLPPLEEQKAIVEKVNALMSLCDALEQEVQQSQAHSEQFMQSCLKEVFEGESKTVEV